jgi:hypothetical protein
LVARLVGDPSGFVLVSKIPELFGRPGAALPKQSIRQDDNSTERCELNRQSSGHTAFDGAGLAQKACNGSRLAALARSQERVIHQVQQGGLRIVEGGLMRDPGVTRK